MNSTVTTSASSSSSSAGFQDQTSRSPQFRPVLDTTLTKAVEKEAIKIANRDGDTSGLRKYSQEGAPIVNPEPLMHAPARGRLKLIRCLVDEFGVNLADNDGVTPLYVGTQEVQLDVVRCLAKEFGADVNQTKPNGSTSLCASTEYGNLEMVRCLPKEFGLTSTWRTTMVLHPYM